jgi:hypothetical protein
VSLVELCEGLVGSHVQNDIQVISCGRRGPSRQAQGLRGEAGYPRGPHSQSGASCLLIPSLHSPPFPFFLLNGQTKQGSRWLLPPWTPPASRCSFVPKLAGRRALRRDAAVRSLSTRVQHRRRANGAAERLVPCAMPERYHLLPRQCRLRNSRGSDDEGTVFQFTFACISLLRDVLVAAAAASHLLPLALLVLLPCCLLSSTLLAACLLCPIGHALHTELLHAMCYCSALLLHAAVAFAHSLLACLHAAALPLCCCVARAFLLCRCCFVAHLLLCLAWMLLPPKLQACAPQAPEPPPSLLPAWALSSSHCRDVSNTRAPDSPFSPAARAPHHRWRAKGVRRNAKTGHGGVERGNRWIHPCWVLWRGCCAIFVSLGVIS